MIIIFGWTTKGAIERSLLDTHCYSCRRTTTWEWFRATEWLTGFFLPVLPIKSEHYLLCQHCKDSLQLQKHEVKAIKRLQLLPADESAALHDRLVERLEAHQMSGKTETQREYLKRRKQ